MKKSLLEAAIVHGPKVVAADGAAQGLLRRGVLPEAVIGDFDSISERARARLPAERCHVIEEQDTTDFEKCLSRIEAPLVIAVGFSGGRLDHQLAVLHGMMALSARRCVLMGKRDVAFLAPPRLSIDLPAGSRVSLFPMGPVAARSAGLRWPLDGLAFAPGRQIGTSNRVAGETGDGKVLVQIETDMPGLFVILPVARFDAVVRALLRPGGGWAVR